MRILILFRFLIIRQAENFIPKNLYKPNWAFFLMLSDINFAILDDLLI